MKHEPPVPAAASTPAPRRQSQLESLTLHTGSPGIRTPTVFRCLLFPLVMSTIWLGRFLLAGKMKVYCHGRTAEQEAAEAAGRIALSGVIHTCHSS
jgi:hypothetical protein